MKYEVRIRKKILHDIKKLPENARKLLFLLIEDLKADGPIQKKPAQFFTLGKGYIPLPLELSVCGLLDFPARGN